MAAIERAYGDIGLSFTEEAKSAVSGRLASRPQGGHGKHEYARADESVIAEERRKYRRYQEYFGVPDEV